ncbi:hypothetical protein P7C73_g3911, partial [Tremellales sp. Uapishka_1]
MPPPVDPDAKIPCTSAHQLQMELENLAAVLEPAEKEDTWEKFERAIVRFAGITRGGGYKYTEVYLEGVGRNGVGPRLVDCMLSDRGRLSGVTTDLLTTLAPRLSLAFQPLILVYLPPLIRLLARPNKVYLRRAEKCLATIITHCPLPSLIPILRVGLEDKNDVCRRSSAAGIERMALEWDRSVWGKGIKEFEVCLRKMGGDKDAEVRKTGKRVWAAYSEEWPERVDEFTAPLTPTIKRYLDISAQNGGAVKPKTAPLRPTAAAIAAPPRSVSATSSSSSSQAPAQRLSNRIPSGKAAEAGPSRRPFEIDDLPPSHPILARSMANPGPSRPLNQHGRSISHQILPTIGAPSSHDVFKATDPFSKASRPILPASFSALSLSSEPVHHTAPSRRFQPARPLLLSDDQSNENNILRGAVRPQHPGRLFSADLGKRPNPLGQAQRRVVTAPLKDAGPSVVSTKHQTPGFLESAITENLSPLKSTPTIQRLQSAANQDSPRRPILADFADSPLLPVMAKAEKSVAEEGVLVELGEDNLTGIMDGDEDVSADEEKTIQVKDDLADLLVKTGTIGQDDENSPMDLLDDADIPMGREENTVKEIDEVMKVPLLGEATVLVAPGLPSLVALPETGPSSPTSIKIVSTTESDTSTAMTTAPPGRVDGTKAHTEYPIRATSSSPSYLQIISESHISTAVHEATAPSAHLVGKITPAMADEILQTVRQDVPVRALTQIEGHVTSIKPTSEGEALIEAVMSPPVALEAAPSSEAETNETSDVVVDDLPTRKVEPTKPAHQTRPRREDLAPSKRSASGSSTTSAANRKPFKPSSSTAKASIIGSRPPKPPLPPISKGPAQPPMIRKPALPPNLPLKASMASKPTVSSKPPPSKAPPSKPPASLTSSTSSKPPPSKSPVSLASSTSSSSAPRSATLTAAQTVQPVPKPFVSSQRSAKIVAPVVLVAPRPERIKRKPALPKFVPTRGKAVAANAASVVAKIKPETIPLPESPVRREIVNLDTLVPTKSSRKFPTTTLQPEHIPLPSTPVRPEEVPLPPTPRALISEEGLIECSSLPMDLEVKPLQLSVRERCTSTTSTNASTIPPFSEDSDTDDEVTIGISFKPKMGGSGPRKKAGGDENSKDLMEFSASAREHHKGSAVVESPTKRDVLSFLDRNVV